MHKHGARVLSLLVVWVAACGGEAPGPGGAPAPEAPDGGGMAGAGGQVPPSGDAAPVSIGSDAAPAAPAPEGDAMVGLVSMTGDAGVDPCTGVSCGAGRCAASGGEAICECPAHVVGAACERCERGYTGRDCGTCVDGYVSDGAGGCIVDPCANLACQNGATCASDSAGARCVCPPQFVGPMCERCAPGHTGPGCTQCLPGYQRQNGVCVVVVCAGFDCNGGTCQDVGGQPVCKCKEGYQGTHCETCAPGYSLVRGMCILTLPQLNVPVLAWFDGAATSTMDLTEAGDVRVWRARNNPDKRFRGHYVNDRHLPRYSPETRGLVFDGDVMVSFSDLPGQKQHYALYAVARWNKAVGSQVIIRSYETKDAIEGQRLSVQGTQARFAHRAPADPAADDVVGDLFGQGGPAHLIVGKRAPFGNGTAHLVSNGTTVKTIVAQSLGAVSPQLTILGMYNPSLAEPEALRGSVHEIVMLGAPPSAEEDKQILTYLRVKWGL